MSTDEKLKIVVSSSLRSIFSSNKASTPISSFDLLTRVISSGPPPAGLLPGPAPIPRLRLTDLKKFEGILECLSQEWDAGRIVLSKEEGSGEVTVLDVQLGRASKRLEAVVPHGKKRKRVVDEDADSAAGDLEEEEDGGGAGEEGGSRKPAPSTLNSLSKEMKEVYSILQRGTARGKLLAEQVSLTAQTPLCKVLITYCLIYVCIHLSSTLQTHHSSPYAPTSPKTNASSTAAPSSRTLPSPTQSPSVTASTSARSSAHTPTPPSATAPTSTHATPNPHMRSLPPYPLYHRIGNLEGSACREARA